MDIPFNEAIENSLQVLHDGGIILYPTDTIWGIGCDATNATAVQRIIRLKQRPSSKSFVVMLADERDLLHYVVALDLRVFDYISKQTRPTTVVYNGVIGLADEVLAEDGSAAIRIVQDEFCRHLIKRFRKPIVSTSANISNMPPPGSYAEIAEEIQREVDYIVPLRQDETIKHTPSSIVRWNADSSVTVIRE